MDAFLLLGNLNEGDHFLMPKGRGFISNHLIHFETRASELVTYVQYDFPIFGYARGSLYIDILEATRSELVKRLLAEIPSFQNSPIPGGRNAPRNFSCFPNHTQCICVSLTDCILDVIGTPNTEKELI